MSSSTSQTDRLHHPVPFALLCERVEREGPEGRILITRPFTGVTVPALPAQVGPFGLFAQLSPPHAATLQISLELWDTGTGANLGRVACEELAINAPEEGVEVALTLPECVIPRQSMIELRVLCNGVVQCLTRFDVVLQAAGTP